MSFGSAASLPGSVPQVPLSPPRPVPGVRALNMITKASAVSPLRSAEEPPRGRVLLVEDRPADALELQRLLVDLGYRVLGPAGCALEAERLLDRTKQWPLKCAVLGAACPTIGTVARRLRARGVPVIWAMPSNLSIPLPFPAPIVRLPANRADLLAALAAAGRDGPLPGCYVTPPPQEAWPREFPQL